MSKTASAPIVHFKSRVAALDGLRGIAIGGVLLAHSFPDLTTAWSGGRTIMKAVWLGAFGVDLFFVLSGFLITGILLDSSESQHYFRNFYARRILRLFPLYYSYLLVIMTVVPWLHHRIHTSIEDYSGNWWWYLTYFSNWKANFAASDPQLGHFWSLAVEEQFYMVWPTVVILARRRYLPWVCIALVVSAVSLRCYWSLHGVDWNQIYRLTVTRWDTIAIGALVAVVLRNRWQQPIAIRVAPALAVAGLLGFLLVLFMAGGPNWSTPLFATIGSLAAALGFGGVILCVSGNRSARLERVLTNPLLQKLGRYSYCMYVVHVVIVFHVVWVGAWVLKRLPHAAAVPVNFVSFAAANLAVFYVAKLSWTYFESRILNLKQYFEDESLPAVAESPNTNILANT